MHGFEPIPCLHAMIIPKENTQPVRLAEDFLPINYHDRDHLRKILAYSVNSGSHSAF